MGGLIPPSAGGGRAFAVIRLESIDLSSPVAFLVICGLALVDGVVPLVPARTAIIAVGVLAGTGDLRAYPLLAVATAAAFVSDNISYWIGAHYWSRISPRLFRGERTRRVWGWVEVQLHRRGFALVALARVVPGGPTPITLTAGMVGIPRRQFRLAAACSAVLWSAYAFSVGLFGDAVTGGDPLLGLVAALLAGGAVNLVVRAWMRRRGAGACGPPPPKGRDGTGAPAAGRKTGAGP